MDCAFPLSGPVAALASSGLCGVGAVELAIVSLLDGEIGDPVTWLDQPRTSVVSGLDRPHRPREFSSVAEDIRAHLPDGAIVVHGADSTLKLICRILPSWRPMMVLDTLSLARQAGLPTTFDPDCPLLPTGDSTDTSARPTSASGRALATARMLLRVADSLPGGLGRLTGGASLAA
jgi:hypothetical protein